MECYLMTLFRLPVVRSDILCWRPRDRPVSVVVQNEVKSVRRYPGDECPLEVCEGQHGGGGH